MTGAGPALTGGGGRESPSRGESQHGRDWKIIQSSLPTTEGGSATPLGSLVQKSGERRPLYLCPAGACLDDPKSVPKPRFAAVTVKKSNASLRASQGTLSTDRCRCGMAAGTPAARATLPRSWWWTDGIYLRRNVWYKKPDCDAGRAFVSWGNG